jgi:hypothetical protein
MNIFDDINLFLIENNFNYTGFVPTTEPTYMPSYLTNTTTANNSNDKISRVTIIVISIIIPINLFFFMLTIYIRERNREKLKLNFERLIAQNMEEQVQSANEIIDNAVNEFKDGVIKTTDDAFKKFADDFANTIDKFSNEWKIKDTTDNSNIESEETRITEDAITEDTRC